MPLALFGLSGGVGLFVNLLIVFLVVVYLALIWWTYLDARRRIEDPVLIACATAANCLKRWPPLRLPPMAVRMLRLGEETGQLAVLAGRVADFYEAKLQRSLDRIVGIAGPAAIIVISVVVGGLIVSVMTALLSVSQIIG